MIKSSLFVRYGFYGLGIALLFMVLAHFTVEWMIQVTESERRKTFVGPAGLIETMLNHTQPEERADLLREMKLSQPQERVLNEIVLVDKNGLTLYAPEQEQIIRESPDKVFELKGEVAHKLIFRNLGRAGFGAASNGNGNGNGHKAFPSRGPGPPGGFWRFFLIQSAALVGAVLLTVFIMISTLRGKAKIANKVIQELTHGNLKVRFPVSRVDEIGQMMVSFNTMADEIEHLIDSLRKSESVRRDLLRELAHDLRTPIASLKSLVETASSSAITTEKREELLTTANREIDYFGGLVEDLLFLGRVSEPRYKSTLIEFDLTDLIDSEAEAVGARYPAIKFDFVSVPEQVFFESDIGLVRRLVRNALENAFSFARSHVAVKLGQTRNGISILIQDDGAGFSEESLKNFGQRKFSRAVAQTNGRRISIGLGSVIMKSIVEAFRGELVPGNHVNDAGKIEGAVLSIFLPA